LPWRLAGQNTLAITAPTSGTSYLPGDTVTFTVTSSDPSITNVVVTGGSPLNDWASGTGPSPFHISIILRAGLPPGTYQFLALGSPGNGGGIAAISTASSIQVERSEAATAISVSPTSLNLSYLGATASLGVTGTFPSGTYTITNSSKTTYTSSNTAVATVIGGVVTAVAAGPANITVKYGTSSATVPVTVTAGAPPVTCSLGAAAVQSSFPAAGGSSTVNVTANDPSCTWSASPAASWIAITPPQYGSGPRSVAFTVRASGINTPRSTSLFVAGTTITINQDAGIGCDLNDDGSTTVADVQLVINQALGVSLAANDLNYDGVVNVADVQILVNAALNLGCTGS